jgi:hypothetical protein
MPLACPTNTTAGCGTALLQDETLYERHAGPDAVDGEWDRKDTVFPHVIRGLPQSREFYDDLRRTPFADELTLNVALRAMAEHGIGSDGVTDLFAVSFAATDIIGHTYGADSQEIMDQMLRLDLLLERLFRKIDDEVGLSNTMIVLTADHGSMPLVETLQARGIDARRASPSMLEDAVTQAIERRFGEGSSIVEYFAPPDFYLNEEGIQKRQLNHNEVVETIRTALLETGLVARVYTHDDIRNGDAADPMLALYQNAFFEPRTADLSVQLKEHIYLSDMPGGTGHGTPYDGDRHVPIIFMGSAIKPGSYSDPCGPEDIAPTLAMMLDLELPRENDSRLLFEMLFGS